jgi:hypothetical protein
MADMPLSHITTAKSPLSGRKAKFFRAVNYRTGQAALIAASPDETVADFERRYAANPPSVVCATSREAAWWWDTEGEPERLVRRNGRTEGEVWTMILGIEH